MSKRIAHARPSSDLSALMQSDREDHQQMRARVAEMLRLREQYAAAIIAAGVLADHEVWLAVVETLAAPDAEPSLGTVRASVRPDAHDIDGLLTNIGVAWGEAGFKLGLAVGMQLGPDALTGGAR
jgi:hypothetical protein